MKLHAVNEWSHLQKVVVGTAQSMGGTPSVDAAYDPKSKEHIQAGTFPTEDDCRRELDGLASLLEARGIEVLRPEVVHDLNQIFTRDIGVVVDDRMIVTRVIEERAAEWNGIAPLLKEVSEGHLLHPPQGVRIEGGDVMPMNGELWVGYSDTADFDVFTTSRTNEQALDWLSDQCRDWNVRGFQLTKSDVDPRANALHLDCCLSVLSGGHAVFHPAGLKREEDRSFVRAQFEGKLMEVDAKEMCQMQCNLISLTPQDVVSCPEFGRVNDQLNDWGYNVICTPMGETAKMEGLLRCVTMPLVRQA
ncbi:MAG: arginine deiminase-related protein [Bacteroidota bacterium]|nr:arginine deiminase-related protein [Bacteroidota bacterium]